MNKKTFRASSKYKRLCNRALKQPDLYNIDFNKWCMVQVKCFQEKDFASLDIPNLIEEIEALSRSEKDAIFSHLVNLLMHMLKREYQPEMQVNSNSWASSIRNARKAIARKITNSPSLDNYLISCIEEAYVDARENAADETRLKLETFPEVCQWSKIEIMSL